MRPIKHGRTKHLELSQLGAMSLVTKATQDGSHGAMSLVNEAIQDGSHGAMSLSQSSY